MDSFLGMNLEDYVRHINKNEFGDRADSEFSVDKAPSQIHI